MVREGEEDEGLPVKAATTKKTNQASTGPPAKGGKRTSSSVPAGYRVPKEGYRDLREEARWLGWL